MPRARDLLQRFRPVGAPGAAAPPGVPADRAAELGRELQPVFDELAGAQAEAAGLRSRAETEARARRDQASATAAGIVDAARRRADAERAGAAAQLMHSAEARASAEQAQARQDAAAVTRLAEERSGPLVAEVLAAILAAGAPTPAGAVRPPGAP